jgi:hypothetical protein
MGLFVGPGGFWWFGFGPLTGLDSRLQTPAEFRS